MVLGALLLGVIVLFVSCSGGDDDGNKGTGASTPAPVSQPASATATPEEEPSFADPPPGAGNPSLPDPEDLQSDGPLGGVDGVEVRGETVVVHAQDSDAVARYLLTHTDARDLEITAKGLEEAFLSLTGDRDETAHDQEPR